MEDFVLFCVQIRIWFYLVLDVFHILYSVLVRHLYKETLIFSLSLISPMKSCNLLSVIVNLFFFLGLVNVKLLLRLSTTNALINVCSVCSYKNQTHYLKSFRWMLRQDSLLDHSYKTIWESLWFFLLCHWEQNALSIMWCSLGLNPFAMLCASWKWWCILLQTYPRITWFGRDSQGPSTLNPNHQALVGTVHYRGYHATNWL